MAPIMARIFVELYFKNNNHYNVHIKKTSAEIRYAAKILSLVDLLMSYCTLM